MLVSEIMSLHPVCCGQHETLQHASELMRSRSVGELPVVNSQEFLVGVITDRDICCRAVADGYSPDRIVQEFMTAPAQTVRPETTVQECCDLMERHQIRRIPVVDVGGRCCGIVALADVSRSGDEPLVAEIMRAISDSHSSSAFLA